MSIALSTPVYYVFCLAVCAIKISQDTRYIAATLTTASRLKSVTTAPLLGMLKLHVVIIKSNIVKIRYMPRYIVQSLDYLFSTTPRLSWFIVLVVFIKKLFKNKSI